MNYVQPKQGPGFAEQAKAFQQQQSIANYGPGIGEPLCPPQTITQSIQEQLDCLEKAFAGLAETLHPQLMANKPCEDKKATEPLPLLPPALEELRAIQFRIGRMADNLIDLTDRFVRI